MGLASKIAAAQGAAGQAPYPGGPLTGPPGSLQAGQRPGGPPPRQGQYQPYPGGPPAAQNPAQAPYPTSSPQPPYQSHPTPNMYNPPPQSNPYGGVSPYRPESSPQPQSSQNYQPPQWNQQQPPHHPQNAYGGAPPQGYGAPQYGGQGQQPRYGQPPYQSQQPYAGGYGPPQGQGSHPPQGAQGGYGQQPQYGQQQGGPPSQLAGQGQIQAYKQLLQAAIQEKSLQTFYPPGSPLLDQIAQVAAQKVDMLCQKWGVTPELGRDVIKLALFDIILYIDDSGSMAFEEGGERIADLKVILSRVAFAASLFDEDGVQVRFMNSLEQGNGIRNEQQVDALVSRVRFSGLTPMGKELNNKILQPLVLGPARSGQLRKPVLIITITDGQPAGDLEENSKAAGGRAEELLVQVIRDACAELAQSRYGKGAVSFQFAQVGNDLKAREFLSKLDEDPVVGPMVDCTSNFEVEADEMSRANPPADLTPELWLMKMLLGAIDSSYDTKDEKGARRPQVQGGPGGYGGAPPQGSYGGPPQQGYGQSHSGYGQPPPGQGQYGQPPPGQGQYGQPPPSQGHYGQPPPSHGQYGQQAGGYGGQGQQYAGGYGRPPTNQPPYGGPQGGYGAPPPPPRY